MPDNGVVERSLSLPGAPRSVRTARRFVSQLLQESGHLEWQEAAELAVSEIVTNAVLHAHTELMVTAQIGDGRLRVDVTDHNPMSPSPRRYDAQATTGRGMSLVAAITTTHGVTSLGPDGKVVWFTLGGSPPDPDVDALLDAWDDDTPEVPHRDLEGTMTTLVGMPPTLWLAARQHHDGLLRELALFASDDPTTTEALALADRARWTISLALERAVADAHARGLALPPLPASHPATLPAVPARVDLEIWIPNDLGPAFGVLQDVLDRAEVLAVTDRLLIRPGLPEIISVRDWACEQVISQLAGAPPAAWTGADAERFTTETHDGGLPAVDWDPSSVTQSDRGAVAADDANRILAVSPSLARALGWDPTALVGRRVVAIVPARFREAHVAGFTRHLATGEAHVLGVPLDLPVLRADGTEVTCSFLIESSPTGTGRTVYTAWITPLS